MMYLKYLRVTCFSFLVSWVVFILVALYQLGAPTESSRWIHELYSIKTNLAQAITKPKLLIIAGSGAHFGISCQMVQQEMALPCVNAATHAGVGADYILYRARSLAKAQDTVILPLEYELYSSTTAASDLLIDYIFARDSDYLKAHPWYIAKLSLERLRIGLLAKFHTPPRLTDGYDSRTVNSNGDETLNQVATITEAMKQKINSIQPMGVPGKQDGFQTIKEFIDWCHQHEIRLLATWPNTIWFDTYKDVEHQKFFQKIEDFYKSNNVPVVGQYNDFMYEKSMFYDTVYHLNHRGVYQRTKRLITLLQPYVKDM